MTLQRTMARERKRDEQGEGMEMADMGYVIIDRKGNIRARQIDGRFGENIGMIIEGLRQAKSQR